MRSPSYVQEINAIWPHTYVLCILKLRSLGEYDNLVPTNCIMTECSVALSTPLQVLDKLEGGQDIHGADIALKRHEAIRTDVEARVSGWEGGGEGVGRGGGGEGEGWHLEGKTNRRNG